MKVYTTQTGYSSLVSTKKYDEGVVIWKLTGAIVKKPTRTSIQIAEDQHVEDEHGIYMNHSFNPTTKIENGRVVAIRNINVNDELTFNYNENEQCMAFPFVDAKTHEKVVGKEGTK